MGKFQRILLPIIGISLIIIGNIAIYYGNQNDQTNPPTTEPPVFTYASPESQGISNGTFTELADTVQSYFDEEMIVGAEIMVIKNRKIVLHEVVGWKDRENEVPMERNTLFNVRSMTKPITGAAVQILIDEGRLRLYSRASDYLPGFDNSNSENITV